ncbi:MAG: 5-amino-6-(D-ribitylamino)uracil--L-tyrosine 4-hydroxyphenyl transferase CofH [Pseudomonadota bacterium]|nr:5-amino-6-(D-ribitylamino)uracil--L-tyrosine 4-hydroxyphenyl transferase CofH [Pseudomonadota bacterium]
MIERQSLDQELDLLKGDRLSSVDALSLAESKDFAALLELAERLRDQGFGRNITYSKKVFIPLTQLCRDVCHYCTFSQPPRNLRQAFLSPEQVLEIANQGKRAGCKEALFTLGDKPELRYAVARKELERLGYRTTLEYLKEVAAMVFKETGLLPHLNPGVMSAAEITELRAVSASMGIMLESSSQRLMEKGMCHYGSPDKNPLVRLETIEEAGRQKVPFTTGLLIGIGETRAERVETLLALRECNDRYGHIQEIIIQNFRAKEGTLMAGAAEPSLADLQWTIALARLIFGANFSIQAPPNLSYNEACQLVKAGINDWGGVSPITPDHVNPEAPWPHLDSLEEDTAKEGKVLVERLSIYPQYIKEFKIWLDKSLAPAVLTLADSEGMARTDDWAPGLAETDFFSLPSPNIPSKLSFDNDLDNILKRAVNGNRLDEMQIVRLFSARNSDFREISDAANELRQKVVGDEVKYVVNRNINYTNVCYFGCTFCAFSKGKTAENLRGKPYDLVIEEIVRRAEEAWARGATEVCLQGGIHPDYDGNTYLTITKEIKNAIPEMHIHAFSPLEIYQGATTLGISLDTFLGRLRDAGLGSLPGTAAEVLDDEVRKILCPDKLNTKQWLDIVATAHNVGLKTTSTIMFGHIDTPINWAKHLTRLRELQKKTKGITEFVPLPFVHMEAPIYLRGMARPGPTWRETVLIHAVARLVLYPFINNIQTSWVKLGPLGAGACLSAGANDLGGTLMNETITRSAGASHGQEFNPKQMDDLIISAGRTPKQRTTLYDDVFEEQREKSYKAGPLKDVVNNPVRKRVREKKGTRQIQANILYEGAAD